MLPLLTDLTTALDPSRLFTRALGEQPDSWQRQLLRSRARQVLLNCSRQSGKSTCTAALALHQALYQPGLILLLAPALRQSLELFRKVKAFAAALDLPNEAIEAETSLRIELGNGGRIETLPGKEGTIRGFSAVSLLIVDEAARVPDELYRAVRPNGGASWERYEVPATDVPRIPREFLDEERRALGPFYAQEYGCEFLDTTSQVFATDLIMAARDDTIAPLW
jgi:hypothetical protein